MKKHVFSKIRILKNTCYEKPRDFQKHVFYQKTLIYRKSLVYRYLFYYLLTMDMDMDVDSIVLPEETALKIKQLEVKCENLETDIKMTDCCFNELDADQEEDRHKIEKLEKRVTQLEAGLDPELRTKGLLEKNLYKLTNRVSEIEVELEKTELLEERVSALNTQNSELRDHLNSTIDTLNSVVKILNGQVIDEEPVVEGNPDGEPVDPEQDIESYFYNYIR